MPHLRSSGVPDLRFPEHWRRRDAAVFAFLARHAATTAQLAAFFFPGRTLGGRKKKASRWLIRQRRRGRVPVVGIVQRRDTGRPEIVYGRRCPSDLVLHQVLLTELALFFPESPFTPDAKVGRTEADAVVVREGKTCFVELDHSGKMTDRQMQAKWKRYGRLADDQVILVVAMTEERMQRLRKGAGLVRDWVLFTTFDRLGSVAKPSVARLEPACGRTIGSAPSPAGGHPLPRRRGCDGGGVVERGLSPGTGLEVCHASLERR